jgi:hypothetical protein
MAYIDRTTWGRTEFKSTWHRSEIARVAAQAATVISNLRLDGIAGGVVLVTSRMEV